jgi:uncharacterized membrane protein
MRVAWFWIFFLYSLGGYLLEKGFARVTRAENQTRKCLLLLPLCPVYGLGLCTVLALPEAWRTGPRLFVSGAAAATAVEYVYDWACQRFLGVRFWDYTGLPGNLHGRVCLLFSLCWGGLTAAAVYLLQPAVAALAERIPPAVTFAAVLVFTADAVCSARFLRLTRDPAGLRLGRLRGT